jgi:hypothetical protein
MRADNCIFGNPNCLLNALSHLRIKIPCCNHFMSACGYRFKTKRVVAQDTVKHKLAERKLHFEPMAYQH